MSKEEEGENQDEVYERIKQSRFKQQNLPAWRPVPTIGSTTVIFMTIGVIFIALGIIILVNANKINEEKTRYDDKCDEKGNCTVNFTLKKKLKKDIMVYYEIDNFYQNHRRYVKSRNDDQLKGKEVNKKTLEKDCDPVVTNDDMKKIKNIVDGKNLTLKEVAVPCGLIAQSFCNDTYTLSLNNGTKIIINESNIAWSADKSKKFKNSNDKSKQWIDMENEHFIVWMRPAALPNFRKLWGRIKQDLDKGNYILNVISENCNVSSFDGKKFFILSEVNKFGGNNKFLGICYIIVGGVSIILSIVFIIGFKMHQKKEKEV